MLLGREDFLKRHSSDFPHVVGQIGQYDTGVLHCEVAVFRRATEQAIDAGRLWETEKHFRFVDQLLPKAAPELLNALDVSFLEDFALGGCTHERHRAARERMSASLREILVGRHSNCRKVPAIRVTHPTQGDSSAEDRRCSRSADQLARRGAVS